jgi:hypothetical protein
MGKCEDINGDMSIESIYIDILDSIKAKSWRWYIIMLENEIIYDDLRDNEVPS